MIPLCKRRWACVGILAVVCLCGQSLGGPGVAKTAPADGASDVDPATGRIVVTFDTAMKTDGFSFLQVGDSVFPETVGDEPIKFTDDKTLVIHVKLAPGTAYAFSLNSAKRQGFKSADGTPLEPVTIRFATSGGEAKSEEPKAEQPTKSSSPLADLYEQSPGKSVSVKKESSPAVGSGVPDNWIRVDDKLYGTQLAIPPGWSPRVRGGMALCIDPDDVEKAGVFFIPMMLKKRVPPEDLAGGLEAMLGRVMSDVQTRQTGKPTEDSVERSLSATAEGTKVTGTYRAMVSRSGMGFIMGYLGPVDRVEQLRPTFHKILTSYRFVGPKLRLQPFRSAAVELLIPPGWQVQTSEANGTANQDIDWVVTDPRMPGVRVFMFTPKYCSTNWVTDAFNASVDQMSLAMWRNKGYEPANIASDEQAIQAALEKVVSGIQVFRQKSLDDLRDFFARVSGVGVQTVRQTGGRWDFHVYELHGRRKVQGVELRSVVYVAASVVVTPHTKGPMGLWSVQVRGYEAPAGQFPQLATMLERVCGSFCYTQWWIREVRKANEQEARQIREFWAYMNKVDREIWDNRSRTQSAINEMMYDSLIAGTPGYVNKETGTIEKIPTDRVDGFKDESGQVVSPEEIIDKKIDPRWATRLREANADDYMNYDRRAQVWP